MDKYEYFLRELNKNFDLDLLGYKRPQMERRINSLMRTLQIKTYEEFIKKMREDQKIFNRFIDHLTINVSEFFRNKAQWDVLKEKIIPMLLLNNKHLKIWSAGCSTGEEPYTLAMILREHFPEGNHSILATDFDTRVLNKATRGIYSQKEASGIPEPYLKKYFIFKNNIYRVDSSLTKLITFKKHNLLKDTFESNFDLILCRNVVIYFTDETKNQLYRKFFNSLISKGVLFTGSTEQIIQAREIGFKSVAIFFYQKP
ncbi:MAG: chemotaxis protein methyltransferase CheR [Clostridia bacterium]|nr:chemotaxis protein methyltransferase CheR [Clostridia bacterium]MDN5323457.1 chemotaxis protein methyltransferase CheR [Clostridia bacterium]